MTYLDDSGKEKLTDEEIEYLEDQNVDINNPEEVDTALETRYTPED